MQNRFDFISTEQELCKITGSTGVRSNGNKLLRSTWLWQGPSRRGLWGHVPQVQECGAGWVYQWRYQESCLPPPCGCQSLSHQCHSRAGLQLHRALLCPGSGPAASGELPAPFPCTAAVFTKYPAQPGFLGTHWHPWQRGPAATSLTPGKCPVAAALAAVCTAKRQSWPGGNGSSPNTVWRNCKNSNQPSNLKSWI